MVVVTPSFGICLLGGVVLIALDWFRVSLAFARNLSHAQTIGCIGWEKLLEARSLAEACNKGRLRSEGKEYVVDEGDMVDLYSAFFCEE